MSDYAQAIAERGLTQASIDTIVRNPSDQVSFCGNFKVKASSIDGLGVFTVSGIEAGEAIGPARLGGNRTPLGRYTNHAKDPNCIMVRKGKDLYIVAIRSIGNNREVTLDYRQVLAVNTEAPAQWRTNS